MDKKIDIGEALQFALIRDENGVIGVVLSAEKVYGLGIIPINLVERDPEIMRDFINMHVNHIKRMLKDVSPTIETQRMAMIEFVMSTLYDKNTQPETKES